MCGICGMIGKNREKEQILERMMQVIKHRGPDGSGAYVSREAALGFQRLSIIDLEQGMQPMYNETGSKVLVFNGEIYNYKLLREELQERGHRFRNTSDSEVLLHGYEEWGTELLGKLRGMFSFAIWDEEKKELFAARDFFGIKPFFYTVAEETFVFASEIKGILEYPGYQRSVNEAALEQYLSFQYSVLPETFFQGIFQLLPGHYLFYRAPQGDFTMNQTDFSMGQKTASFQSLKVVQYFKPGLMPSERSDSKEMISSVKELVEKTVERHLVSDVKVGSFLSGGVDSSLLVSASGCDATFTVGFQNEGALYDETTAAKSLADSLQIENHCKYITKEEFEQALPKVIYHLDEPLGDASAVALYFLSREASKEVKVVLSGEGSDELFGGYNIYLEPEMLRYIQWLPRGLRRKTASLASRLPRKLKGRSYLMRGALSLEERYIGNAYIFHQEEKEKLLKRRTGQAPESLLRQAYDTLKALPDSDQMQSIDLMYWLPGDILLKADRMSMANSLEVRVPFLDLDVFEAARILPHRMKFRRGVTKYTLRKASRSFLPEPVAHRRKLGFPIPIRNWMKEEDWYQKLEALFLGTAADTFFHREYLLELLREHREGRADHSRKLWTVAVFLIWHRIYFETNETKQEES